MVPTVEAAVQCLLRVCHPLIDTCKRGQEERVLLCAPGSGPLLPADTVDITVRVILLPLACIKPPF